MLVTDLAAAGLDPPRLAKGTALNLTITNTHSTEATLRQWAFLAAGSTAAFAPELDGDGPEDGTEMMQLGTIPLARDPDGDGFLDGVDPRPFTPDDPPNFHSIWPKTNWSRDVVARVTSRHSIEHVTLRIVDSTGSRLVTGGQRQGDDWNWTIPSPVENNTELRFEAKDNYGNIHVAKLFLEWRRTSPTSSVARPSHWASQMMTMTPSGVPIGPAETPRLPTNIPSIPVAVVAIVALVAYAAVTSILESDEGGGGNLVLRDRIHQPVYPPEYEWPNAPPNGCRNRAVISSGAATPYVKRGIAHMRQVDPRYADPLQIRQDFERAAAHGQYFGIDKHRANIQYYDAATQTLEAWDVVLPPDPCAPYDIDGVAKRKTRGELTPEEVKKMLAILATAAGAAMLWDRIKPPKLPEDPSKDVHTIHVLDGRQNMTRVREIEFIDVQGYVGAFHRAMEANLPAHAETNRAWALYLLTVLQSATKNAADPIWYWRTPSVPGTEWTRAEQFEASLVDEGEGPRKGVFFVDDRDATDAWQDFVFIGRQGFVRSNLTAELFGPDPVPPSSYFSVMDVTLRELCDWTRTHPEGRAWLAASTLGTIEASEAEASVELTSIVAIASNPSEFRVIGPRGGC